jgi:hypothetical protein
VCNTGALNCFALFAPLVSAYAERGSMNVTSQSDLCELWRLLAGGVTARQCAITMGMSRPTVMRYLIMFGEAAKDSYGGNVEDGPWCGVLGAGTDGALDDPDIRDGYAQAWREEKPITVAGWTFRPLTDEVEREARKTAIAKGKTAKLGDSVAHYVAIRVVQIVLIDFDGSPPIGFPVGVIEEPWQIAEVVSMATDPCMPYIALAPPQ